MGVLSAVLGVFSKSLVELAEPPAAGEAGAATNALIAELRRTKPEEIRRDSTHEYLEMVIQGHRLDEYCNTLAGLFGEPCKPFGVRGKFEEPLGSMVDGIGGVEKGQCLYLRRFADHRVAFATLWPWDDPTAVTVKVGVLPDPMPPAPAE